MSAFAVIFERSNAPLSKGVLKPMLERLHHRGPDGSDTLQTGCAALGHLHFWTTPEEQGEKQPLELKGSPLNIVFDGRLDNRAELIANLGMTPQVSDAALALQAYSRWGQDCFVRFIGEFALAVYDAERRELTCARDPLGDRTLFYSFTGTQFTVASEPWAVAACAADSTPRLSERAAAHYFALQVPEDGQTLFENVFELMPAQVLVVDAARERRWRYWQADLSRKLRGLTDAEYAERFRALLEESVRCRMRSIAPVGVLMSGGLDSTSVACLAAGMMEPNPLTTISYVFDELKDCDERPYINAVKEKVSLHSIQIPCDDAWPYKNWEQWPRNPNQPEGNPYRLLKERAYQRADRQGLRVLLTGGFGDHLYSAGADWLADLLAEGRFREAARELLLYIRHAGLRWTLSAGYIQRAARRWLGALPFANRLRRRQKPSAWLTPQSAARLPEVPRGGGNVNMLGALAAQSSSSEIVPASRHHVELRHPYRDRRLVEFVLSLPAHQLFFHGRYKHVLRNAMRGILPEVVRDRHAPTSLASFYFRGVERERGTIQACLESPEAAWRKFVRAGWLAGRWNVAAASQADGPQALVPWLCVSFEAWHQIGMRNHYRELSNVF